MKFIIVRKSDQKVLKGFTKNYDRAILSYWKDKAIIYTIHLLAEVVAEELGPDFEVRQYEYAFI